MDDDQGYFRGPPHIVKLGECMGGNGMNSRELTGGEIMNAEMKNAQIKYDKIAPRKFKE